MEALSYCQLMERCLAAEARVVELEQCIATQREYYEGVIADGGKRIAELESRTVTVKMPKLKMLEDYLAEVAVEERKAILLGVRMEFHRALNAEGIKWEVE